MERYYGYQKIHERFYRIMAFGSHCCELILGDRQAALLDTGLGLGNLPGIVREITQLPLIILNTHSHVDHAAGNALFDVPGYMGAEDIETYDYACGTWHRENTLKRHALELPLLLSEGFDPQEYVNRRKPELRPCSEGDQFDLGGVTLAVYETPGHSLGGRSYYWKEYHYLFTGDAVYPRTLVFGYGSARRAVHIKTLEKISVLPFDRIYGNHREEPMTHRDIDLYLRAAREVRYEDGVPFPNPIKDGEDARTCCLPGFTPQDENKEGFAALVLSSYS